MRDRAAFQRNLIRWFQRHRRDLPWRRNREPYRVWISELMLQQTRVDQVVPYYRKFIRAFPTVRALAKADLQRALKLWEGLGYYARARNAHKAAREIVENFGGKFPDSLEGLRRLPGVGPYTAAAVGSIAFNLDAAVVDGNVIRVISRAFALPSRAPVQKLVDALLPRGRAGLFNEALMELGAIVCAPKKPNCARCPLRPTCRAAEEGDPLKYPVRKRRSRVPHKEVGAGVIINQRRQVLIAQRPEGGMLGGMWEFPGGSREKGEAIQDCIARELREELGIETAVGENIVTVPHAFSHFTMNLHAHWVFIKSGQPRPIQCAAVKWVRARDLRKYPFPKADLVILNRVLRTRRWPAPPR